MCPFSVILMENIIFCRKHLEIMKYLPLFLLILFLEQATSSVTRMGRVSSRYQVVSFLIETKKACIDKIDNTYSLIVVSYNTFTLVCRGYSVPRYELRLIYGRRYTPAFDRRYGRWFTTILLSKMPVARGITLSRRVREKIVILWTFNHVS